MSNKGWISKSAAGLTLATSPMPPRTKSGSIFCATVWRFIRTSKSFGHSPVAVIDEADSILIDEARIPLVIAGGETETSRWLIRWIASRGIFRRGRHFTLDEYARNIALTDAGIRAIETSFGCGNLVHGAESRAADARSRIHCKPMRCFAETWIIWSKTASSNLSTSSKAASRRTGAGRRDCTRPLKPRKGWRLRPKAGFSDPSPLQNLISLYPMVCGMTGTAATQADEFRLVYGLEVDVIPTNRPMIRADLRDRVYAHKFDKERAVLEEIRRLHAIGRPVLVGTRSVEESERLSARLPDIPHQVLNARHEEQEAGMIARAGPLGAVTISTNMSGRGTDIQLGPGVAELGGLHVIGTNRHESRRIDNQLRGRAGRQGDPGSSEFFISFQDDMLVKYGIEDQNRVMMPQASSGWPRGKTWKSAVFYRNMRASSKASAKESSTAARRF